MKDSKTLLILLLTIVFILLFALLFTWGYDYYSKQSAEINHPVSNNNGAGIYSDPARDSLQKVYSATISKLDTRFVNTPIKADSLNGHPDTSLAEYYKLRNEIAAILASPAHTADLDMARQKIGELQIKVAALNSRNRDVEQENIRLNSILQQLLSEKKTQQQGDQEATQTSSSYKNESPGKTISHPLAIAELTLSAIQLNEEKEEETSQADKTEKLVGSFTVKNTGNQNKSSDMIVVVVQPDGKVLQKSTWESGTFETNEGRRIYSCKMQIGNNGGEARRLVFSLSSDKYQKGNYTLQIYHEGVLVGKMVKTLT